VIEIKALCAMCGPSLYYQAEEFRYFADGEWVKCLNLTEVLDLATAGVTLKTYSGHTIRPLAHFLLNGSALCGLCIGNYRPDLLNAIITGGRPLR